MREVDHMMSTTLTQSLFHQSHAIGNYQIHQPHRIVADMGTAQFIDGLDGFWHEVRHSQEYKGEK